MKKLVALGAGLILLAANAAFADLTPIGDPVGGNSWSQRFQESGAGYYDLMAVRMTSSGDTFESATFSNFNPGTWSLLYENDGGTPTLASASGPSVNWAQFDIKFAGDSSNQLAFDFVAFKTGSDTIAESVHAAWNNGWTITAGTWNPTRAQVVPLPAAVLLGMLGMGVAGLKLRKFV
jgi:hypothetical protein